MITRTEARLGRIDAETHRLLKKRRGYISLVKHNVLPETMVDLLYILETMEDRLNTLCDVRLRLKYGRGSQPSNTTVVLIGVTQ